MKKSVVIRLSGQVENEYSAFLGELQKLEVQQYPTKACLTFIKALKAEVSKNLKRIKKARKNALNMPDDSDEIGIEIDEIRATRTRLIDDLMMFLDWVSGAQTRNVPWSLVPSAERLAKRIIPNRETILYCENKYNYGIFWFSEPTGTVRKYCFVSLPRLHCTNVLMHAIIGHELFHPRCKDFTEQHKNATILEVVEKCKNAFPELDPATLFGLDQLSRKTARIIFIWERALHELLCDMFCAALFGPAALLAMRAFASFSGPLYVPSEENNFYPPWQYRYETVWQRAMDKDALEKLLGEILKYDGIQDIASNFQTELDEFRAQNALDSTGGYSLVQSQPDDGESKLLKIAYEKVHVSLSLARDYVFDNMPDDLVKWTDDSVLKQVPPLVNRLKAGIPPNEITDIVFDGSTGKGHYTGEAPKSPAILLAGWIYQTFRQGNGRGKKNVLSHETLARFLLKGLEDGELLRYK